MQSVGYKLENTLFSNVECLGGVFVYNFRGLGLAGTNWRCKPVIYRALLRLAKESLYWKVVV